MSELSQTLEDAIGGGAGADRTSSTRVEFTATAAVNVHVEGERVGPDLIVIPPDQTGPVQ